MDVTVAISTWNRAEQLDATLLALTRLRVPPDLRWELVVVNNGCADATDQVLRRWAGRLPLRRLYEPQTGLSHGRNRAAGAARGRLVVFTDDDVRPEPQWLAAYAEAERAHGEASFFGGPIEPWFASPPPAWIQEAWPRVRSAYGWRDLGPDPVELDEQTLPFGANFAVRAEVLGRRPFDPRLGRTGPTQLLGEETALMCRLLREGHRGRWTPAARLRHVTPSEHLTVGYLQRRFFGVGRTAAILEAEDGAPAGTVRLMGRLAAAELKWRLRRWVGGEADRWVKHCLRASYLRGRLAAARRPAA